MSKIEFSRNEKDAMVMKIQKYFDDELQQEIGQFDAEFLLDFFSKECGAFFYNRGLYDAKTVFDERMRSVEEDLYAIEQSTQ